MGINKLAINKFSAGNGGSQNRLSSFFPYFFYILLQISFIDRWWRITILTFTRRFVIVTKLDNHIITRFDVLKQFIPMAFTSKTFTGTPIKCVILHLQTISDIQR